MKNPASLDSADLPESNKESIRSFKPSWSGDKPIASYTLTNNNANIRRLKERAERVAKMQAATTTEETINGVTIEVNPGENRIRVHFPARIPLEDYKTMKRNGFRVAKSLGENVFSAFCNRHSLDAARLIAGKVGQP